VQPAAGVHHPHPGGSIGVAPAAQRAKPWW
jgi:hypothetical protein